MCGQSERDAERQRYRQGGGGGKKRGERISSSAAEGRREEEYSEAGVKRKREVVKLQSEKEKGEKWNKRERKKKKESGVGSVVDVVSIYYPQTAHP